MALPEWLKGLFASPKQRQMMRYARMLSGYTPVFSQFGDNIYASDIVQMCIDRIATECSKLRPKHVRTDADGMQTIPPSDLNRLFKIAPNPLMTTRDFLEKIIWQLYMNYNAFVYPTYTTTALDNGRVIYNYTGMYPVNPSTVTFMQDLSDRLFVELVFANGDKFTLPYSDLIHLRKKFSVNDVMGGGVNGQPDNTALLKILTVNDTVIQGLDKAVKTSLNIRGILKMGILVNDDTLTAERERFEAAVTSGQTGILPLDSKGEYTALTVDPKIIDKDTMEFIQSKVLNWYGVSLPILRGDFTDEQYQAFYEETLEPLIISLGQAFSKCLFTQAEVAYGNEIAFYPQKLLFTNVKNKIAVADILGNRGALTNNALLEMFGYPPYEGGNVRQQSLNYIDVALASEYQLKRAGIKDGGADDGKAATKN